MKCLKLSTFTDIETILAVTYSKQEEVLDLCDICWGDLTRLAPIILNKLKTFSEIELS